MQGRVSSARRKIRAVTGTAARAWIRCGPRAHPCAVDNEVFLTVVPKLRRQRHRAQQLDWLAAVFLIEYFPAGRGVYPAVVGNP